MKKYFSLFTFYFLLLLLAFPSFGQDVTDLSLTDAVQLGLKNNYQVIISQKNLETAKIDNSWGNAGRYPSITASLTNRNRYDNTSALSNATGLDDSRLEYATSGLYPALGLQWSIFNGWAVNITKDNLQLLEELSQGNSIILIENTIQAIISAYYLALLEKEKLAVTQEVMQLSSDRYKYVQIQKELGTSVTFDVLQVKTAFLADSANFLMQTVNYTNSLKYINYLLGDTSQTVYNLTENFEALDNTYNFLDLREKTLSNNSTLKNQYINQKMLENSIGLAKSSYYPNLSLSTGTDYNKRWTIPIGEGETMNDYAYDFYLNLTLSYSIYNGGAKKRAMQKALINQDMGDISISEMEHKLENDLYRLHELYKVKKQLYKVSLEAEESAALNLQLGTERFKNGSINSFNLRDLSIYYLNAANQRLESIYNLIQGHTDLLRITGGIVSEY